MIAIVSSVSLLFLVLFYICVISWAVVINHKPDYIILVVHGSNYIERSVIMKPTYAGKIKNLGTQVVEALFKGGSTKSGKVKTGKDLRTK